MTTRPDPNWASNVLKPGYQSKVAPSLIRAWHGYLLAAYPDNSGDPNIWVHLYSPYPATQGFISKQRLKGPQGLVSNAAPVSTVYANMSVWFILQDGSGGASMCCAPQPPRDSSNEITFGQDDYMTCTQRFEITNLQATSRLAPFVSQDRLCFLYSTASQVCCASTPLPVEDPLSLSVTPLTNCPQLKGAPSTPVFWNGYWQFLGVGVDNTNRVVHMRFDPTSGQAWMLGMPAFPGGIETPVLVVEPGGEFLIAAFLSPDDGGTVLTSYCELEHPQTWGFVANIPEQKASFTPALASSGMGECFLMYRGTGGSGDQLYLSRTNGLWNNSRRARGDRQVPAAGAADADLRSRSAAQGSSK